MNASLQAPQAPRGQSLWLDNITRAILIDGSLRHYIEDLAIAGLTSNPAIFQKTIDEDDCYDAAIARLARRNLSDEALYFELAIEDLARAADLFRPIHLDTGGVDGWVSLEIPPLLANDAAATIVAALALHRRVNRRNVLIKIPGTQAGLVAIEEVTYQGVPTHVTLLFSREQYLCAAAAWMRGIERRQAAGLSLNVASVASLCVSRWDHAVQHTAPAGLTHLLGIAIARRTYRAYLDTLASTRMRDLQSMGASGQRLLWTSTGVKEPAPPDTLFGDAFAAPDTINTIPEATLRAFAEHGRVGEGVPATDPLASTATVLQQFRHAGFDLDRLASALQVAGTASIDTTWQALMARIAVKRSSLCGAW